MIRYFAVYAWDREHSADARAIARDDHFSHLEANIDRIAVTGPLKGATGSNIGTLFILMVDSADEAERFMLSDPYNRAEVWSHWEIHPFLPAAGQWIGGSIW